MESTNGMIKDTFIEMIEGSTYYNETAPEGYEENYMSYDLKYTCGELVVKFNTIEPLDADGNPITNPEELAEGQDGTVGVLVTVVLPLAIKYIKQKTKKEEAKDE